MLVDKLTHELHKNLSIKQAKQIHGCIVVNRLHNLEPLLVSHILFRASTCSRSIVRYLQNIHYHSKHLDATLWGRSVRYFSQHGQFKEALDLYVQMQRGGICPSSYAVTSALRACSRKIYKTAGLLIHGQSWKCGFCGCVYVQTALVDFYSKLGDVETAQKVFDETVDKNVVSWNSFLSMNLKCKNLVEARTVFDQIPSKDVVSWNSMISGYAKVGDMDEAWRLFQQMPERTYASWNAMVSGYVKCGNIESAKKIFDAMPRRNSVSCIIMISGYSKCGDVEAAWKLYSQIAKKDLLLFNAMISCFAQNSMPKEALWLFDEMLKLDANVQPDEMTLVSVISSCSQLGDLRFGLWIESYIENAGMEMDDSLVTALIDLYAKCGSIDKADKLFHTLKKKDVIAYSAMIWGCAINGKASDAVKLFETMLADRVLPNPVTFTGLLTACNHAGMVDEGYKFFNSIRDHELAPSVDHYAITVDLLGRAGRFQEAYELIKSMPTTQAHVGFWGALLLGCSVHNNVEFGEIAAQHCFRLEPNTTAYYSLLANIYASVGRWEDSRRLRKEMEEKELTKMAGCSWMESS